MAAQEVATRVAQALRDSSRRRGDTGLIVPGGRSPRRVFELLVHESIPWHDIIIIPSDERVVPDGDRERNDVMIRKQLINDLRIRPQFLPMLDGASKDISVGTIASFPWPAEVAILGMGSDGHVASLFPGQESSWESSTRWVHGVAPEAPLNRISLSLDTLRETRRTMLLVFGQEKNATYQKARGDNPSAFPVSALLRPGQGLLEVHRTYE